MGVLFDSAAAASAGVFSVFLAFGNVLKDTHSLLEATSHICSQSCHASRGFDEERAAFVALSLVALVLALRTCRRRGSVEASPPRVEPALSVSSSRRSSSGRRRQVGTKSQVLAHLAVDAKEIDQWLL